MSCHRRRYKRAPEDAMLRDLNKMTRQTVGAMVTLQVGTSLIGTAAKLAKK